MLEEKALLIFSKSDSTYLTLAVLVVIVLGVGLILYKIHAWFNYYMIYKIYFHSLFSVGVVGIWCESGAFIAAESKLLFAACRNFCFQSPICLYFYHNFNITTIAVVCKNCRKLIVTLSILVLYWLTVSHWWSVLTWNCCILWMTSYFVYLALTFAWLIVAVLELFLFLPRSFLSKEV